jgi:hypothetical protein
MSHLRLDGAGSGVAAWDVIVGLSRWRGGFGNPLEP